MEFKARAFDERLSKVTPQLSSSNFNPLSGHGLRPNSFFNGTQPDPVVLRELEKAKIREEIIASEIARRRALEAEVRRELMAEWDWEIEAIHRARQTGLSNVQNLSMHLHPNLPFKHHFNKQNRWRPEACFDLCSLSPQPRLPQHSFMLPSPVTEVQDTSEAKRDKLIVLAKPDPNSVVGAKRKTPPLAGTSELPLSSTSSKVKQLECAICQVNATSEKALAEHLRGKKHKANEARQIARRMVKNSNTSSNTVTSQKKLRHSDKNLEDKEEIKNEKDELLIKREEKVERFMKKISADPLEKKDGPTAIDEMKVTLELGKKKKYKFWCEICSVGAHSKVVMETHEKGKKHIARLKELDKNNVATLATATTVKVAEQAKIDLCSDAKATDVVPTAKLMDVQEANGLN